MRRNRTLIDIIEDHERDIKRLRQALARVTVGAINHGTLTGLADDDHPQYVKAAGDTMTGQLKASDGSAALPSLTFSSYPTTGMYLDGANSIGWATQGVEKMQLGTGNLNFNQTILGSATILADDVGSANTPAFTFGGDLDTGMYRDGANVLGFATGTVTRMTLGSSFARFFTDLDLEGNEVTNSPTAVRRLYRVGHSVSGMTTGSSTTLVIDISGAGFTDASKMYVNIIGNANNQYSYKSLYAYIALSTTSITVRISGLESIGGTGTAFFQVQITEYYA